MFKEASVVQSLLFSGLQDYTEINVLFSSFTVPAAAAAPRLLSSTRASASDTGWL